MTTTIAGGHYSYGHIVGILMNDSISPRIPGDPGHAATFLSNHPEATPKDVKEWLLEASEEGRVRNFYGPSKSQLREKSLLFNP